MMYKRKTWRPPTLISTNIMSKRPDQIDAIRWQRDFLYVTGFYALRKNWYYYGSCIFFQTVCWLTVVTLFARMYLDLPDVFKFLNTLQFSITHFAFLAKGVPFILRFNQLVEMQEELKAPVFNSRTLAQDRFIQNAIDYTRTFARAFWTICVVAVTFFCIHPLVDGTTMAVPAWYPFDVAEHRYFVFVFQSIGFLANAYSNSSIDLVMAGFISLMSAQMNVLMDTLMNLTGSERNDGLDDDVEDNRKEIKPIDSDDVIYERLIQCVVHHEAILSFVNRIESMFSLGVLFQFFASILTICLTGIVMLTVDVKSNHFLALLLYFLAMLNQIALNCWFGHDIMGTSDDLMRACYMNNWYKTSPRVRKGLFIMMEKAKRPVLLTAGKVFALNLSTLVAILRSSYSYFAVLNRVYGDTLKIKH